MNFTEIVGNSNNKELLVKIIKNNNVLHSYSFIGASGIGKFLFAKEFAKSLLCLKEEKPCDNCKSCIQFNSNNHPDYIVVNPEDNSIKINQIRELNSKIIEKPITSNRKIYIINDSDLMTKEAQNCLLKTLEEPPEYVTIILIAENEELLLNTIKSRCMKINFCKLSEEEMEITLKKKNLLNKNTSKMLDFYNGSIGKALLLNGNEDIYLEIEKKILNINKIEKIDIMNYAEYIVKNKEIIFQILDYIIALLFSLLKKNMEESYKYYNCIEIVNKAKEKLKANNNLDMTIDYLLISIWEEINEKHNRS